MRNLRWTVAGFAVLGLILPVLAGGEEKKGHDMKPEAKPAGDAHAAMKAEIGKPAPEFTLKDSEGKEHKLSAYKGKIVVLEWINHECPVCQKHYKDKSMANTFASFKDKNVVWLAIDSSNFAEKKADSIKKWWKDQGNPFPYLMDASGAVGKSFGAKNTPHMFVVDAKGILAYIGAIDDNSEGNKPKPTNYVADAVNALIKGTAVATATTAPYGCQVKY
ncbi:MAG: redoxin domain-containing protein [Planctomycetota bacterium]